MNTGANPAAEVVTEIVTGSGLLLLLKTRKEFWVYSPWKQLGLDYAFEYVPKYPLLPASGFDLLVPVCLTGD